MKPFQSSCSLRFFSYVRHHRHMLSYLLYSAAQQQMAYTCTHTYTPPLQERSHTQAPIRLLRLWTFCRPALFSLFFFVIKTFEVIRLMRFRYVSISTGFLGGWETSPIDDTTVSPFTNFRFGFSVQKENDGRHLAGHSVHKSAYIDGPDIQNLLAVVYV